MGSFVSRPVKQESKSKNTIRPAKQESKTKNTMENDIDIKQEAEALSKMKLGFSPPPQEAKLEAPASSRGRDIPLNWVRGQGGHRPNADTKQLLKDIGGVAGIQKFTELFYKKAFQDPQIDAFLREHQDPHGMRFALWITEKFGGEQVWTADCMKRKTCPFMSHGRTFQSPHDRSSAHHAAWHSPKRERADFGKHFKLDDCRVWMRLHFWALREAGVWETCPDFGRYYVKLIGHFVSVYENTAPPFAREAARWSADPRNIERYLEAGRRMPDIKGLRFSDALGTLPANERGNDNWPYSY